MPSQFTVFISHVSEDESIAVGLKRLIETVFLNAQVFVAGRDLSGGEVWIKEIRDQLRTARVIIAVITPFSRKTPWVMFEAGAGFVDSRTIPVCADGISIEALEPPLKLLQARSLSEDGLKKLIVDIARRAELREPEHFPGLHDALSAINDFVALRRQSGLPNTPTGKQLREKSTISSVDLSSKTDPELLAEFQRVDDLARTATITSIERARGLYDIPSHDELTRMDRQELGEITECFNIPRPSTFNLTGFPLLLPNENDSKWKKMNARKSLQEVEKAVQKFLKELSEQH